MGLENEDRNIPDRKTDAPVIQDGEPDDSLAGRLLGVLVDEPLSPDLWAKNRDVSAEAEDVSEPSMTNNILQKLARNEIRVTGFAINETKTAPSLTLKLAPGESANFRKHRITTLLVNELGTLFPHGNICRVENNSLIYTAREKLLSRPTPVNGNGRAGNALR